MEEGFTGAFIEAFFTTVSLAPFLASLLASFTDILPSTNHFFTVSLPSFYPHTLLQGHLRGHTGTFTRTFYPTFSLAPFLASL